MAVYADLNGIHNPATGTVPPASWGDQIRENFEFLIEPPSCAVSNSTVQSVASATFTSLTADTESLDNASMHSTSVNTSRITITVDGTYLFSTTVRLAASVTTGNFTVRFIVNGTTSYVVGLVEVVTSASAETIIGSSIPIPGLVVGDYVEVQSRHSAASNQNHELGNFSAFFMSRN